MNKNNSIPDKNGSDYSNVTGMLAEFRRLNQRIGTLLEITQKLAGHNDAIDIVDKEIKDSIEESELIQKRLDGELRYRNLEYILEVASLVTGAIFGAFYGAVDAGLNGLLLGGLIGLSVGVLPCCIVSMTCTITRGIKVFENGLNATTLRRFAYRTAFSSLQLCFGVVLIHEGYWGINLAANEASYNTGACLTQILVLNDSRDRVRKELTQRRREHLVFASRPIKWLLTENVTELNATNMRLIDRVNGKEVESNTSLSPSSQWLGVTSIMAIWQSDIVIAKYVTDRSLSAYGVAVCKYALNEEGRYQSRGWILRHLPRRHRDAG